MRLLTDAAADESVSSGEMVAFDVVGCESLMFVRFLAEITNIHGECVCGFMIVSSRELVSPSGKGDHT